MPGISVVPGGPQGAPDLSFLQLPVGFCAHYYAHVGTNNSCCLGPVGASARGDVRQLRFAPGGELFITSPTAGTTGGCGCAGAAAILVLPDDDHDGAADGATVFLGNLPMTQGLLFANGYLYYQDDSKIMRLPYAPGDRAPSGPAEQVADIFAVTHYYSSTHWPKALDLADDGTIYVTAGGDQSEHTGNQPPQCALASADRPFHGGILKLDESAAGGASPVAKGFRNPISLRCARNRGQCFAVELTLDYSFDRGREKLVPIRQGDDWGYPCCATQNLAYSDYTTPVPDCSAVAPELGSFLVGHTPFDLDFETGKWPEPWKNSAYVVLHGEYGDWTGEGIIAIDYDAMTGNFLPGSDLSGMLSGSFHEFAGGWELPLRGHGRPANLAFAPDGRLFVGNDVTGDIFWIAPLDLESHS
jgi:glucose/arabinose dehydrogenase